MLDRGLQTNQLDRYPSMDALLEDIAKGRALRRNIVIGLGVAGPLALVGAGVGLTELSNAATRQDCVREAESTMFWPTRAESTEASIAAMKTPYGAATFDAMSKELDAFAEGWVELYADACYDEKVEHEMVP